ncbi:MAG: glycosyltransferase, partial [Calditrichia bacterium]
MTISPHDKIKTLQLVSVPWWNASAYYGIILAKALEISGIPTIVAGRGDSPPLLKAKEYALTTHTEINLETFNPAKTIHNYLKLKQLLRAENILLINSHRPQDHIYGALARKSLRSYIPLIRTVSDVRYPKTNAINYWLHNKATDFFIFTCIKSYERYQSTWPIFENRSAVIYSAIDTDYFQPA